MPKTTFPFLVFIFMLSACASNIPIEIQQDANDITIDAVRSNFERYKGQYVRWGGTIIGVENNESDSWIEIVGKQLNSYGKPKYSDHSLGRFLVRVEGFVDPAIYKTDRVLTVYGVVESRVVRQIDEHPYTYTLIEAEKHYLWREYNRYRHYAYYYPYYYPYRYYYPYHFGFHFGHHFGHHHRYNFGYRFHHW
jgi:outer membrane lipoprotein